MAGFAPMLTTPVAMRLDEALDIFWPELEAVTIDCWCDEDLADDPEKVDLGDDIRARQLTPAVLKEIEHCLTRDWCADKVEKAALVILAEHKMLERFDPKTGYSRRPRTRLVNGIRYVVG